MLCELECIRQQILQHLLQALRVGDQTSWKLWIGNHFEGQLAILRFVPEGAGHHLQQVAEEHFLSLDRNRSRLDLRQIKNVADQVKQVSSGAMDGTREFNLLWRQIVIRIFAELLSQNQNRVQRGTQLM